MYLILIRKCPVSCRGDPGRIRQVLINLIGNALKFTEKGEVQVNISPVLEQDDSVRIRFEVVDSGIGIPGDRLNYLFESFTQADSTTSRKFGGTGLGLAICKQLTQMMNGEIGVESKVGHGSRFWFEIPLQKQASSSSVSPLLPIGCKDRKILIVDDNEMNRFVLKKQLAILKIRLDEAVDGFSALELLKGSARAGEPLRYGNY